MFDRLIHADWSVADGKRWMAIAERWAGGWAVGAPEEVGAKDIMLDRAFSTADQGQRVLIGFDFPIGVPVAYGALTELGCFRDLLNAVGQGSWHQFFEVAKTASEISIGRPFYPAASRKGVLREDLVKGLGVASFNDLLRICELKTEHSQAACSLFWTLGGNQVGKGALSGWKEMVVPALRRGASLWPFDGTLAVLACHPGVVLTETYPALAYRLVNAGFLHNQSKRRQDDRREKSCAIQAWAESNSVKLSENAKSALNDGFGRHYGAATTGLAIHPAKTMPWGRRVIPSPERRQPTDIACISLFLVAVAP